MYHDGKTYFWLPTKLTFSTLNAEALALVNQVHTQLGLPLPVQNAFGEYENPYYLKLNDFDLGGGPFLRDATPGMSVCGPVSNTSYFTLQQASLFVVFNGDVEGLPVWFEISDINASVPVSLQALDPERTTWATWGTFGESHKPTKIGTKWYRSNAVGQSGQLLDASQFVNLGLRILTKAEYQAIQPVVNP